MNLDQILNQQEVKLFPCRGDDGAFRLVVVFEGKVIGNLPYTPNPAGFYSESHGNVELFSEQKYIDQKEWQRKRIERNKNAEVICNPPSLVSSNQESHSSTNCPHSLDTCGLSDGHKGQPFGSCNGRH